MQKILNILTAFAFAVATFLPGFVTPVYALSADDFTKAAQEAVAPNAEDLSDDAANLEDGSVESAANALIANPTNVESQKQLLLAADQKALDALAVSEEAAAASPYFSDAQKQQLKTCNDLAEAKINQHMTSVQAATTQAELVTANQAYVQSIDQAQVQACVMTAVALGVEAFLEASEIFLNYSIEYLGFMPQACLDAGGQDILDLANKGLDEQIPAATDELNAVFADGTISETEVAAMDSLVTKVYDVGATDLSVYLGVTSGIELCAGL